MRKPYIAPNCDYMTFTVDSAIAAGNCNISYSPGYDGKHGDEFNCTWMSDFDDILFNKAGGNKSCTTDASLDGSIYCYTNSSSIIFGS